MLYRRLSRRLIRLFAQVVDLDYLIIRKRHAKEILQSDYRRLLFHDRLNFANNICPSPPVDIIHQDKEWTVLEINSFQFMWPTQYQIIDQLGYLYNEVFAPVECNPHAYEFRRVRISPGDWVIDAGACEGFFTHFALERGANVLAIEPVPKLAEALSFTFEAEIRQGRVKVLQGALGAKHGQSNLSIPLDKVYCSTIDSIDGIPVDVYSLDELILEESLIPTLDFVKMDIEGGEIEAIEGAKEILRRLIPKLSIAVYHEAQHAKIMQSIIRNANTKYEVQWRGIFIREDFGAPRPYMLYALSNQTNSNSKL